MPYRPQKEKTSNGKLDGPPWLGFQDAKILSFEDMSVIMSGQMSIL